MRIPAFAGALMLLASTPALAGSGDLQPTYDSEGTWSTRDQVRDVGPSGGDCVKLLERAFYLEDPANFRRAMDARHEMELARQAFRDGDEFACTRHAIHALEDRT
jgi:hypothetical protein